MAKRMIEECDFCKEEVALTANIEIKKGKKKSRSYDICDDCAEKLEHRLVSTSKELDINMPKAKSNTSIKTENNEEDLITLDDGSTRPVPTSRPTRTESAVDITTDDDERVLPQTLNKDGDPCPHMNRTGPRLNADTKGKIMVRCRDCGASIAYVSAQENAKKLKVQPID